MSNANHSVSAANAMTPQPSAAREESPFSQAFYTPEGAAGSVEYEESVAESLLPDDAYESAFPFFFDSFESLPEDKENAGNGGMSASKSRFKSTLGASNQNVPDELLPNVFNKALTIKDNNAHQWSLNDFIKERELGQGQYGKVWMAREKRNGEIYAIKEIPQKAGVEHLAQREINIHSSLHHPNIVKMYGHFSDSKCTYLLLEYCEGGWLYNKQLSEATTARCIFDLADALHYCHQKRIMHRDIKPENVLIGNDHQIRLADFGFAVQATKYCGDIMYGTPCYMPPEMVEGREHDQHLEYDEQVDVWSLGVLLFELLVGESPFEEEDEEATYQRISRVDLNIPAGVPGDAQDLICKLLKKNPKERMSLALIPHHPWIVRNARRSKSIVQQSNANA